MVFAMCAAYKKVTEYISHTDDVLWDFEVVTDDLFFNVNRIHPLKQDDVAKLVRCIRSDTQVAGLIVFGSAVRFDCHSGSDIDILVIRDDDKQILNCNLSEVKSNLDIIFHTKLGVRLADEIARTGVVVYERG